MIRSYNDKNKLPEKNALRNSQNRDKWTLETYKSPSCFFSYEGQRLEIFNCESPYQDTSLGGLISGDTALSQLSTKPREILQKVLASSH